MRLALACTLLIVVGGCASPPSSEGGDDAPVPVITDPRDTAYLSDAAPGSHVHDYWGGRERVPVLRAEGSVWSTCTGSCADGMRGAERRPDEGAIVPQGTRWVNGTFSLAPHAENDATRYELWVKTAQDAESRLVQELRPGEPFSIPSTKQDNDPPHYVLSLWRFEVVAKKEAEGVTFRGDYRWDLEAVRGLPLEAYPPHPDRWGDATELTLLEDGADAALYYEEGGARVCYGGLDRCPGRHALPGEVVVPHDAARVEVRVRGTFVLPSLSFHGADTWELSPVAGRQDGADTLFVIPLDTTLGDSPYAPQSLWEFHVGLGQPQPVEVASGAYTVVAKAFR